MAQEKDVISVKDKVVIITGSSKGIGKVLALGFARSGAFVVLAARTADDLEAVAGEIKSQGGKALAVPTDVTRGDQVSQLIRKTVEEFGRIDVLINCAGGGDFTSLLEMSEEAWDNMVDFNLKSVYLCCRAVGKIMTKQKGGSIINFSSGAASAPMAGMIHYGAAKAGVEQFTRMLAVEWGPLNVRVNAISPGLTETEHNREVMGEAMIEEFAKSIPLRRQGQPEDMVGLALFLASEASSYITGTIIPVSGGPQ